MTLAAARKLFFGIYGSVVTQTDHQRRVCAGAEVALDE